MALKKITTIEEFENLLNQSRFFLLKNSTTCSISTEAFNEYERVSTEIPNATMYYLNVQEARPLSNYIAETFEIKHESPQAFLFENGSPVWNDSHWKITYKTLKDKW